MEIKHGIKNKHLVVDKEWVKDEIQKRGLYMIESTFTILQESFFAFTTEGYIVKVTPNSIYKNHSNLIFSSTNPYTIYNINRFIFLNNIPTTLLSIKYANNTERLKWRCSCGEEFETSWNSFLRGQHFCKKCARRKLFLIPVEEIRHDFSDKGYKLLTSEPKTKTDKVEYVCLKHAFKGAQSINLRKFYNFNQGCKYCGIEKRAETHSISKDECKEITTAKGLDYIDSYVENGKTIIKFTCKKHLDKGIQYFSITQMRKTRCGCKYCNMSTYINEEKIDILLKSWNIHFERQRSFGECRDKNALPFDFYLPEHNTLIEYQGEQHYIAIRRGNMTKNEASENLILIQKHDKIKRDYCKTNKINYIEIPYWENDDIENYIFDEFIKIGIIEEIKKSA